MLLTYLGHAGFMLEAGGTTLLIDPWVTGNPVATTSADALHADTILLSHAHNDHGIDDALTISKRTGATIITTFELGEWLAVQGASTVPANHGGTVPFNGGSVKFTPAWHTSSYETGPGTYVAAATPAGLVIRFGGLTIYHTGDTALFRDMEFIGEEQIDLMCVCIGDRFTMGPVDATRAVGFVHPKTVIPMHYNTFPPIVQDGDAFKERVESAVQGIRCYPLKPGQTHRFGE